MKYSFGQVILLKSLQLKLKKETCAYDFEIAVDTCNTILTVV